VCGYVQSLNDQAVAVRVFLLLRMQLQPKGAQVEEFYTLIATFLKHLKKGFHG